MSLVPLSVGLKGNSQKAEEPFRKNKGKHQRNQCKLGKYFFGIYRIYKRKLIPNHGTAA